MPDADLGSDRDADKKVILNCEHCGRLMLTVQGMRRVCRECLEKLNKAANIAEEDRKWQGERERWFEEERRLWGRGEVG